MSDMYFQNLPSTSTPITAENLNKLNDIKVSSTQPNTGEKVWFKQGKNLFNKDVSISGYKLGSDGDLFADSSYSVSEYIEVKSSTAYVANWNLETRECVCYYTESKTFISRNTSEKAFTTPSNCKWIRISRATSSINATQVEQGSIATTYEPYIEPSIYIKNDNGVYEKFKRDPIKMKVLYGATLNSNGNITTDIVKSKYAILSVDSNAGTILCTPFTYNGNDYWVLHFYKIADGSAASNSQIDNVKIYYTKI